MRHKGINREGGICCCIPDLQLQLSNRRRNRQEGIGLGLSIVKKLCDLLQYHLAVRSSPGVGSVFSVQVPLASAFEPAIEPEWRGESSLDGVHALVVDDEIEILRGMRLALEGWGCTVDCAESFRQAKAAVAQQQPDIVLCDYRLQDDMNGIEVLQRLNADLPQVIPAIVITGDTEPGVLKGVAECGYALINKPVKPEKLREMVEQLIR